MRTKNQPELVIEAGRSGRQYWKDLWHYRELFYFLAWRDTIVRYKQTVVGITWAILSPLITMTIMTIVFGRIAKLPSDGVPYPLLVLSGMLPWLFFSHVLNKSSVSMVSNANLVSKIYFPRLILPISTVMVASVDFLISLLLLAVMMIWYKFVPSWSMLTLPLFWLLTAFAGMGAGIWVSALNVKYRDFTHIVPFLVQIGMYITPVGYSLNVVPERWRFIYSLNPMVGVIHSFRWAILGHNTQFYWPGFLLSLGIIFLLLLTIGIYYFRKTERTFADII